MRVKWNGTTPNTFSTSNGVKQGGVLSQILFNVYTNELILLLSEQGVGCHLHGQFVGALCDNYATVYNVIFNSKKTVCIKFGNEVIRNEAAFLNNQLLKWNEKVRHLGNIIDKDCTELADCVFNPIPERLGSI